MEMETTNNAGGHHLVLDVNEGRVTGMHDRVTPSSSGAEDPPTPTHIFIPTPTPIGLDFPKEGETVGLGISLVGVSAPHAHEGGVDSSPSLGTPTGTPTAGAVTGVGTEATPRPIGPGTGDELESDLFPLPSSTSLKKRSPPPSRGSATTSASVTSAVVHPTTTIVDTIVDTTTPAAAAADNTTTPRNSSISPGIPGTPDTFGTLREEKPHKPLFVEEGLLSTPPPTQGGMHTSDSSISSGTAGSGVKYMALPRSGERPHSTLGMEVYTADMEKTLPKKNEEKKRPIRIFLVLGLIIGLILVILLPIIFKVILPRHSSSSSSSKPPSSNNPSGPGSPNSPVSFAPITGSDGSTVYDTSLNTTFTYVNPFGGTFYFDPANPIPSSSPSSSSSPPPSKFSKFTRRDSSSNPSAQAQSFTPPLNTSWQWGIDTVRGVNLGGWLVLEPFITPKLFQKYLDRGVNVVDEWTLSVAMRADTGEGGGIGQIEEHYASFITEQDFAQIAGAGLNWVRLPVPFWAISTIVSPPSSSNPNFNISSQGNMNPSSSDPLEEPFLARVAWGYVLKALMWARKYGLRVLLEVHTAPGSQNGYNHSGKDGQINFLNGVMGLANGERMETLLLDMVNYFWGGEGGGQGGGWDDVIGMFGLVNEARPQSIGDDVLSSFYIRMHDEIRKITGFGEGKGPYIAIHDGFEGISHWAGTFQGADRIALDSHPYFAFSGPSLVNPQTPLDSFPSKACEAFGPGFNASQSGFGVTLAGEFSGAMNDCGFFLHGPNAGTTYESQGGDCTVWENWEGWDDSRIGAVRDYVEAQMDAMHTGGGWFFWTWKIGEDESGKIRCPVWSYQLGVQKGWIPPDPRSAIGKCAALGVSPSHPFDGTYQSWQTGGQGAGTIVPSSVTQFPWPPSTISGAGAAVTALPTYTNTGSGTALGDPTISVVLPLKTGGGGGGSGTTTVMITPTWRNDNVGAEAQPTSVSGCSYPNAWNPGGDVPSGC